FSPPSTLSLHIAILAEPRPGVAERILERANAIAELLFGSRAAVVMPLAAHGDAGGVNIAFAAGQARHQVAKLAADHPQQRPGPHDGAFRAAGSGHLLR